LAIVCALSPIAVAITCFAPPAIAGDFDGNWSMVAVTTSGHCGEIPIDVEISRGRIFSTGGSSFGTAFAHYPIQLVGRVSASGQVRMNAVAGPRIAQGTGRFNRFRGSGTWAGTGPSGVCSGVWNAAASSRGSVPNCPEPVTSSSRRWPVEREGKLLAERKK
jgi:hypothetical protein